MTALATREPQPAEAPTRTTGPDQGVIEEARRRQRRRQGRLLTRVFLTCAAIAAASWGLLTGGGSGHGSRNTSSDATPSHSVGSGIEISYARGWHVVSPPITSLQYLRDRLLLTSYPATRGGACGPTRAENALPADGTMIFLFEYSTTGGSVFGQPKGMSFPRQSAGLELRQRDLGNYECSTVPSYLIRFKTAGRLFQAQVAFGPHATQARRAEALRVLMTLRARPLPQD